MCVEQGKCIVHILQQAREAGERRESCEEAMDKTDPRTMQTRALSDIIV